MRLVAPAVLLILAVGAAAVGGYAFIHSDVYAVSPRTTLCYVYLPLAVAALCLAALPFRKVRGVVVANIIAVGIAVVAAEAYIGYQNDQVRSTRYTVMAAAAEQAGRPVDKRVLWEVVSDLRAVGSDSYPTFSPTQFLLGGVDLSSLSQLIANDEQVLPLTNIANTKSVYCNESGQWLVFDSDRFGFNNPDRVWDASQLSVAVVGDSFAQGACVQPGQSVAALLREQGVDALTVGVGGTGPLVQLAVAKEYLTKQAPGIVFWFFYEGNDIHTNLSIERNSELLRRYLKPGFRMGLPSEAEVIDGFLRTAIDENVPNWREEKPVRESFTATRITRFLNLRERFGLIQCPTRDQDFELLQEVATEFRRTVSAWGGKLVVVYLPSADTACDLFEVAKREDNWLYDSALTAFEAANLPIIDLRGTYFALGKPPGFYFYPGSHFSPEGYAFVAKSLREWLNSTGSEKQARGK